MTAIVPNGRAIITDLRRHLAALERTGRSSDRRGSCQRRASHGRAGLGDSRGDAGDAELSRGCGVSRGTSSREESGRYSELEVEWIIETMYDYYPTWPQPTWAIAVLPNHASEQ
jgi:hypothetical protein